MDFFDDLLGLFGIDADDAYMDFSSHNDTDLENISKISEEYGLQPTSAEELLEVIQAIQHSTTHIDDSATLSEINDYVDTFAAKPDSVFGLINNVKGLYGEHQVYEHLKMEYGDDFFVVRDYATNNPDYDFAICDPNTGDLIEKLQVKITSDPDYVLNAKAEIPDDITVVTTDEALTAISEKLGYIPEGIVGIGLSNGEITSTVETTINLLMNTDPEFEVILTDPVMAEYLDQCLINPFSEV